MPFFKVQPLWLALSPLQPVTNKILFILTLIAVVTNTDHFVFNYSWLYDVIYFILFFKKNLLIDCKLHKGRVPSFLTLHKGKFPNLPRWRRNATINFHMPIIKVICNQSCFIDSSSSTPPLDFFEACEGLCFKLLGIPSSIQLRNQIQEGSNYS